MFFFQKTIFENVKKHKINAEHFYMLKYHNHLKIVIYKRSFLNTLNFDKFVKDKIKMIRKSTLELLVL